VTLLRLTVTIAAAARPRSCSRLAASTVVACAVGCGGVPPAIVSGRRILRESSFRPGGPSRLRPMLTSFASRKSSMSSSRWVAFVWVEFVYATLVVQLRCSSKSRSKNARPRRSGSPPCQTKFTDSKKSESRKACTTRWAVSAFIVLWKIAGSMKQ
jgi:hypothetical protein